MTIEAAYLAVRRAEHRERPVWDDVKVIWHVDAAVVALVRMRWVTREMVNLSALRGV